MKIFKSWRIRVCFQEVRSLITSLYVYKKKTYDLVLLRVLVTLCVVHSPGVWMLVCLNLVRFFSQSIVALS